MKQRYLVSSIKITLILISIMLFASLSASAQTADEIVTKNIAARGGLEKLKAIKTLTITGHLTSADSDIPITVFLKRDKKYRVELIINGEKAVQVYDGQIGWEINPNEPNKVNKLSGKELDALQDQADMTGFLTDYKAKGHSVTLVGKETVNGQECFKLKVTLKTGNTINSFIDAKTFLEVREELSQNDREVEESLSGYKEVNGVVFAHEFDSNLKGSPVHFKLTFDKIALDQEIDDAKFVMPNIK